jgi:enoyl-CoA hydratase/carnithine racemase
MIEKEAAGSATIVRLAHGKVNALDVELLDALVDVLRELEASDVPAVVLTGAGRAFSAGVDLRRLVDGGSAYAEQLLAALSRAFVTLFEFPRPVVAAVNGAAIAGGCILACACDRRLLSDAGAPIGTSELRVAVPFPAAALEIVRYAAGDAAETAVLTGALYTGTDAVAVGFAHEIVPADELVPRAVTAAEELVGPSPDAYRLAKSELRRPTLDRIADAAALDREVQRIWASEATRANVAAFLERTVGRR